jgi:NADPH-dependent F420 reductase
VLGIADKIYVFMSHFALILERRFAQRNKVIVHLRLLELRNRLFAVLAEIKDAVKNKIVVTAVVPLVPPKVFIVQLPQAGSAALMAQAALDSSTKVVGAFHNVGAQKLHAGSKADCDVLVFGDDAEARAEIIKLANAVSNRGVDGGALANSAAAEALTSVLIAINRKYKVKGAGLSISGLA